MTYRYTEAQKRAYERYRLRNKMKLNLSKRLNYQNKNRNTKIYDRVVKKHPSYKEYIDKLNNASTYDDMIMYILQNDIK